MLKELSVTRLRAEPMGHSEVERNRTVINQLDEKLVQAARDLEKPGAAEKCRVALVLELEREEDGSMSISYVTNYQPPKQQSKAIRAHLNREGLVFHDAVQMDIENVIDFKEATTGGDE